jgi:hypothetical protein
MVYPGLSTDGHDYLFSSLSPDLKDDNIQVLDFMGHASKCKGKKSV